MKTKIAALVVAAFLAAPAVAQELETYTEQQVVDAQAAIDSQELTDEAYQHFWCGSAFLIINQLATNQGMTAEAEQALAASDALFGKAAAEMIALGMPEPEFTALAQNFRIVAISQTGPGSEADYAQEDCVAAAQAP